MKDPKNNLPLDDLEQYGIYQNGKLDLAPDELTALKRGHMTDLLELKNVSNKEGKEVDSLFARLSVVADGPVNKLRVDPVYVDIKKHPLLNEQEEEELISGQVANIRKSVIDKKGNENVEIIEFDNQTNQFISYDPRKVNVPEEINGSPLTREQKKRLKEGEVVVLEDGTEVQLKTTDKAGINSNMKFLVMSIVLDGGLSFLVVTLAKQLVSRMNQPQKVPASKNYREVLIQAEKELEKKAAKYPNDPAIADELKMVRQALGRSQATTPEELKKEDKQLKDKNYREVLIQAVKELEKKAAKYPNDPAIQEELGKVRRDLARAEAMNPEELKRRNNITEKEVEAQVGASENEGTQAEQKPHGRGR